MKINSLILIVLVIGLEVMIEVSMQQDTVVVQQKTLIEDMMKKPACANKPEAEDPAPELPAYEPPPDQRTI